MPRAPPAISTSEAPAQPCSTGCLPAIIGGKFILRIEDTDFARSSEEMVEGILQGHALAWTDWDEGPFFQSQRLDRYREFAAELLEARQRLPMLLQRRGS